ncbi:DNA-binding transcriptional regulator LysR [compost metagenome]
MQIRRLQTSVPFRVQLIRPEYRPSSALVDEAEDVLKDVAEGFLGRLESRLRGVIA